MPTLMRWNNCIHPTDADNQMTIALTNNNEITDSGTVTQMKKIPSKEQTTKEKRKTTK